MHHAFKAKMPVSIPNKKSFKSTRGDGDENPAIEGNRLLCVSNPLGGMETVLYYNITQFQ